MNCPKCQAQNLLDGSKFCNSCGADLTSFSQPSIPSTPQAPTSQPTAPPVPSEKAWWEKWWGILILVLLAGPLGMIIIYLVLKKSNLPQTTKTVLTFLIGLLFFSLSVYWGWSQVKQKETPLSLSQEKTTVLPTRPPIKKEPTPLPTPTPAPALKTVGTEFQGVEASLTKIERGVNMVTAYFTFTCSGEAEYNFGTPIDDPSFKEYSYVYDLSFAYLVDDVSQMKYEVMKDATGKALASLLKDKALEEGQSFSLYAQFTAPPETTTTVTITLPMVQPFTNISLE